MKKSLASRPRPTVEPSRRTPFALRQGTGGIVNMKYLLERQARGYPFPLLGSFSSKRPFVIKEAADDLNFVRKELRLSITDLATLLGVSRQAIYKWQEGEQPSLENEKRLKEFVKAAHMLNNAGFRMSSWFWKRKVKGSKSLFEMIQAGMALPEAVYLLLEILAEEENQRKWLDMRLKGRNLPPQHYDEYGIPMLEEDID